MKGWQAARLGEVCSLITDGKHGDCTNEENSGYYFISAKDIRDGIINYENARQITQSDFAETHRRTDLQPGDLLVTNSGTIGRLAIVHDNERTLKTTFQKSVAILKPKPCEISSRFLYYYLTANMKAFIHPAAGAAQKNLLLRDIRAFRIYKPSLHEQDNISRTLSNYDDLIENNRRRITLLEQAARLLYREWFVHFRFPGHERVKIVDGIPEGWERVRIEQVLIALESGGRPRGGALESDGIPSIGAENVIGLGQYDYSKEKYVPEDYFTKMRRGVIQSRDVMLYKDGAHIGRSSMFGDGFPHSQCAVNEHVFLLRADADVGQSYLYFWLSQPETRQSVVNLNANTAQPGISQDKLKTLWFLLPPEALRHLFNESIEAQVAQIFRLALMNQKLAQARDLLLPRLMNGEIAV